MPKFPQKLLLPTFTLAIALFTLLAFRSTYLFLDSRVNVLQAHDGFFLPWLVQPEPYKVLIYLVYMVGVGGLFMGGAIILKHAQWQSQVKKWKVAKRFSGLLSFMPSGTVAVFSLLTFLFVWLLGSYPMFEWNQVEVGKTLTSLGYTFFWCLIIFGLPVVIKKVSHHRQLLENIVVLTIVAILTYQPTFPVSVFDYTYLIGPAAAIATGQTIYTQAPSQYGLGSILLFATIQKVLPGSLLNMAIWMWALYVIEVMLVYFFVRKTTNSFRAGLLAVGSLLTLSFFSIIDTPFGIPQAGAFRWLPYVAACFLILKTDEPLKKNSARMNERISVNMSAFILISIAFLAFLVVDVGIAITVSLGLYWGFRFLTGRLSVGQLIKNSFLYGLGLLLAYFFFSTLSLVLSGSFINLFFAFHTLAQYGSQGVSTLPLTFQNFFWLYVLTMISGFVIVARSVLLHKKETDWHRAVLLSTLLLLTASIYFVNRSHPHNLLNLSSIWLLQVFILLTPFLQKLEHKGKNLRDSHYMMYIYALGITIFILVPALARQDNLSHIMREKIGRLPYLPIADQLPFLHHLPPKLRTNFSIDYERDLRTMPTQYRNEVQLLQTTFPQPNQPVALFSLDDTYLLYVAQRPNLLWSNPLNTIISKDDLAHALQPLLPNGQNGQPNCPQTIAYDPLCIHKETCTRPPNYGYFIAQDQVYAAFTKICGQYQQYKCAGILCVAKKVPQAKITEMHIKKRSL